METISIAVKFIDESINGGLPKTGDFTIMTLVMLLFTILFSLGTAYCLLYCKRTIVGSSENFNIFQDARFVNALKNVISQNKKLVIVSIAIITSFFVIISFYSLAKPAYAIEVNDQSLEPSTNEIVLSLDNNNKLSYSECKIKNISNQKYTVKETEILLSEEASKIEALKTSFIVMSAFDGILYEGNLGGNAQAPKNISDLLPDNSTNLIFDLEKINPLIIKGLSGKEIFTINIYPQASIPEKCIATLDFKGIIRDTNVPVPEGWEYDSVKDVYTKEVPGGKECQEVVAEWTAANFVGISNLSWESISGIMDEDKVFSPEITLKSTLDDYSWQELKMIADDLSAKEDASAISTSAYYNTFKNFAEMGNTKSIEIQYNGEKSNMYYRIIGINHDTRSSDNKKAGLTFFPENCFATQAFGITTGEEKWSDSETRDKLNPGGTDSDFYNALVGGIDPDSKSLITPVKKDCAVGYIDEETYSEEIYQSSDYFFLLSITEMNGQNSFINWDDTNTVTGWEGFQYEYIENDTWLYKTKWHDNLAQGPILCNYIDKSYPWLLENYKNYNTLTSLKESGYLEQFEISGSGWMKDEISLRSIPHGSYCQINYYPCGEFDEETQTQKLFRSTMTSLSPICPAFCM